MTIFSYSGNIPLYNGTLQLIFGGKIPLDNHKLPLKNIF